MFKSARIKLTAWYLAIIMLVSISFSIGIYKIITHEVERFGRAQRIRLERVNIDPVPSVLPPHPQGNFNPDIQLVEETKTRIASNLVMINIGILIFAGLFGYFLAGKTLKPIKEMVDEQNRFITDASHEFRTPLTALKSSMEVFLRDPKATISEAKELIKSSISDVDNMNHLSDSLLQLSQYQTPNENIKFESVNLAEIIINAVKQTGPLAKVKKLMVENRTGVFTVEGNRYSLYDLLVILLENAIKYSRRGSKITIETQRCDNSVQISVKDEGMGISKKDLPHIFNRFYRADDSRTLAGVSGYGLGLSIAKSIVTLHHGTIKAESTFGEGTVLVVSLPIFSKISDENGKVK